MSLPYFGNVQMVPERNMSWNTKSNLFSEGSRGIYRTRPPACIFLTCLVRADPKFTVAHRGIFYLLFLIFCVGGPLSRALLIPPYNWEGPMFCNEIDGERVMDALLALNHRLPSCLHHDHQGTFTSRRDQPWPTTGQRPPCRWNQIWRLRSGNYSSLYD